MRSGLRWSVETDGELADDACELLVLAKLQGTTIGRNVAAIEIGEDLTGRVRQRITASLPSMVLGS